MKKLILSFLILSSPLSAQHLTLGAVGSAAVPHGDFRWGWNSGAGGGAAADFSLTKTIPAEFSLIYSFHERVNSPEPRQDMIAPAKNVHLINTSLMPYAAFPRKSNLQAVILGGVTSTMFLMTNSFPPEPNSDESEIGVCFGGGVRTTLCDRFSLSLKYRQTVLFTEPHPIRFSTLYTVIGWKIIDRSAAKEKSADE